MDRICWFVSFVEKSGSHHSIPNLSNLDVIGYSPYYNQIIAIECQSNSEPCHQSHGDDMRQ